MKRPLHLSSPLVLILAALQRRFLPILQIISIDQRNLSRQTTIDAVVTATETIAVPGTTVTETGAATHTYSDSFLPSFFPTFGVSKKTQIWIYGAAGLIVAFCVGLGIYSIVQRRKRLRNNPRDKYEFEMVGTEDDDEARRGLNRHKARRGGELYDAFADGSDDDLYSDDEGYQDTPDTSGGSNGSDEKGQQPER